MALVELSVVEQRYRAVLEATSGVPVTEVAERFGVSRQSIHAWIRRYERGGLGGLMDRSRRPESCPHQVSAEIEAVVCEMRRDHPRWGPLRMVHELGKAGVAPVPSRMSVYRVLVRHGLIEPVPRKRPKDSYVRWEREAPMALWQLDIVGGVFLADGTEAKIVTGVDDHSRYCVICQVVARATGRAVCLAFAGALRRFGIPGEVLSDNGKQFTDRFGKGGEVLFDRICRDNAITHRLTAPRHPTTTGKIERFHGSLRRELLDDAIPFTDLAAAQAAIDAWVIGYNTTRPHQALGMATPAQRFSTATAKAEQELLPLRLPSVIALAPVPAPPAERPTAGPDPTPAGEQPPYHGGPVEFERVVPPSGNMEVRGKQFWLGTARTGLVVTFWASVDVIHLTIGGARVKSVRSHLSTADLARLAAGGGRPAGPPPLPPAEPGAAIEVDRVVSKDGQVSLGGRYTIAAEILGLPFSPTPTPPHPHTRGRARRAHTPHRSPRATPSRPSLGAPGASSPSTSPRTPSASTWTAKTPAPSAGPPPSRSAASKPTGPARPGLPMFPRAPVKHHPGLIRQSSGGTRHVSEGSRASVSSVGRCGTFVFDHRQ